MADPVIRRARFDELDPRTAYLLWQLRERVFVVEQECAYLDLDGRDLSPTTWHLWADDGGTPVAYLRLLEDGDAMRIGRVLTAPDHRGRGLAARLVQAALVDVGDRPCRLDAQSHLEQWYVALGFTRSGEEFLEDGIPHVPMELVGRSPARAQSARSRP